MCAPSPPAPDPAVGKAAAANADVARESLAFSKQVYEEGKPRQEKMDAIMQRVVDNSLSTQDKQAALSDEYTNYLKGTFWPLEKTLADEAKNFDTNAKREELAARAGADVSQAVAMSDDAARRDAARFGVNPGDAAFTESLGGSALNRSALTAGAMNNARTQARAEGRALKFDVSALGRGLPGAGSNAAQVSMAGGQSALGANSAAAANVRSDAALRQQGFQTAIQGNSSAANILQGQWNGQTQAQLASDSANTSTAAGVGTAVATVAVMI